MSKSSPVEVCVLMATYNGAQFVREQLESILKQDHKLLHVHVADDGSHDATLEIIEEYVSIGLVKSVANFEGLTPKNIFLELLSHSCEGNPIAFCDQDDIWKPDKTSFSLVELENCDLVAGQRSNFGLQPSKMKISRKMQDPSLENALVQNIIFGNTIMLSASAAKKVRTDLPGFCNHLMHDSLLYLYFVCFGKISLVDVPLINYRIHSENFMGLGETNYIRKSITLLEKNYLQAQEFFYFFNQNLTENNHGVIKLYLNAFESRHFLTRFKLSFSQKIKRVSYFETLIVKFLIPFIRIPRRFQ
jgi:glycosyltransferase involved in cell wall biosynthesis